MAPAIPQSQKNAARMNARRAWRDCIGDSSTACVMASNLNRRDIGQQYLAEANELAEQLIEYWEQNGVCEPATVFVAGEPGCEGWDE